MVFVIIVRKLCVQQKDDCACWWRVPLPDHYVLSDDNNSIFIGLLHRDYLDRHLKSTMHNDTHPIMSVINPFSDTDRFCEARQMESMPIVDLLGL